MNLEILKRYFIILSIVLIVSCMGTLSAQEIEPRAYANVPAGLNVAALSYSLSHGNIVTDASLPLEDFNVTAHTPVLAYVRTLSVFGKLGRIQVVLPFTHLAGDVKLAGKALRILDMNKNLFNC